METRTPPIHGDCLRLQNDNEAKMATTLGKEKYYAPARSQSALQKRSQQLQIWAMSDTNKQPTFIVESRKNPRVRFGETVVFMAAAQSGDVEEVERLVQEEGADANSVNKDGLTALHQCCIDDDFDMVQMLVRLGADVNVQDHEGWTPLHAAASCELEHIVRYLLDSGAFPSPVNNEGDTPLDLVEEGSVADMIKDQIEKQGIDVEEVRTMEEQVMLEDAHRLKNDPSRQQVISPGGATLLHIAASKNYLSVMKVLLSVKGMHSDPRDDDGWTPLHAAVYWGYMEAAEMLVAYGADLMAITKTGELVEDLCDPELVEALDDLKKLKEEHNNRQRRNAMIHSTRGRPASLSHMNSREDLYKDKPSPVVRRRSSKERSLFPKQDMLKERAERENWATDSTETNSVGSGGREERGGEKAVEKAPDIVVKVIENSKAHESSNREPSKAPLPAAEEAGNNNAKEAFNSANDLERGRKETEDRMNSDATTLPQTADPSSNPQDSPQTGSPGQSNSPRGSPKLSKKRPNMSSLMLKRVGLWETSVPSPSPRTSTPLSSPQVEEGKALQGATGGEVKRFPFQPKTITPQGRIERTRSDVNLPTPARPGGMLAPRTSSFDEANKRSSFDEARFHASLKPPEDLGQKASSLPRGAKMVIDSTDTRTPTDKVMPVPECVVSSEATPTPATGETSRRSLSRENSVESNTSRSFSVVDESETRRRSRARRTRESRKQTQPVSAEDLDKALARDGVDDSVAETPDKGDQGQGAVSRTEEEEEKVDRRPVVQSAFRPLARPTSRLPKVVETPVQPSSGGLTLWSKREAKDREEGKMEESVPTATSTPREPPSNADDSQPKSKRTEPKLTPSARATDREETECLLPVSKGQEAMDESDLGASGSTVQERRKSNARRRPRQARRSTGLTYEADANEVIPEELACFVKRKEGGEDGSSVSEDYPDSSSESGSLSVDGEVSRLKQLLQEAESRRREVEEECSRVRGELERHQSMVLELNRKYEDVSRAHEQERREREQKEARIAELEAESKTVHVIKKENQRLKDENSALIRVIGKLSRTPLQHTSQQ